jgi:parallel beta-helix repeat protein
MFVTLLFSLLGLSKKSPQSPRRSMPRCRAFPRLEVLEDRLALNNYVVGNLNDNGNGSLRQAIINLNNTGGQTNKIVFQAGAGGFGGNTISLQSALPLIQKNVTITGPGFSSMYVQGNGNAGNPYRIFDVDSGVFAEIDGLTIEGGYLVGGNGAGIYNSGTLTLKNDFVYLNDAAGVGGSGGGIFNGKSASLTLVDTDVAVNSATGNGGGIANLGTLDCQGAQIYSNTAANGGGLFNLQNIVGVNVSALLQLNTLIYSNSATTSGGGVYESGGNVTMTGFSGGSIYSNSAKDGGGIYILTGNLTLTLGVTVENNSATNNGGGIYLADNGTNPSTATLKSVTIQNNKAGNLGVGIALQGKATCQETSVTDTDDPGGKPVPVP